MAKEIRVDTARVLETANNLASIQKSIQEDFEDVEAKIKKLDNTWSGEASEKAMSSFLDLKNHLKISSKVINFYIQMLRDFISTGYFNTEEVNTSLGDMFK